MIAMPFSSASLGFFASSGLPSNRISPSVGKDAPLSSFISVDFPAPFSPMRECTSPLSQEKFTWSSAVTPGNFFVMFFISSMTAIFSPFYPSIRQFLHEALDLKISSAPAPSPVLPVAGYPPIRIPCQWSGTCFCPSCGKAATLPWPLGLCC